jgi:hypothetical protein
MIVYSGNIPYKHFPFFRRQKGLFFNRIIGINLYQGAIEPVYLPLVEIAHEGKLVWIVIYSTIPLLGITLMRGKPFIHIERIKSSDD